MNDALGSMYIHDFSEIFTQRFTLVGYFKDDSAAYIGMFDSRLYLMVHSHCSFQSLRQLRQSHKESTYYFDTKKTSMINIDNKGVKDELVNNPCKKSVKQKSTTCRDKRTLVQSASIA
ncbi:hypothetical protein FCM35_KLT06724 [Carex littledalei]|uniref:Uncharacterized protein n=1 Tax=Carex littledalei TaxID=544730 RepID=A0A833R0M2_9POAL|nr:hypothetical protein FCM35_KLT06724 [Carex littledalei]